MIVGILTHVIHYKYCGKYYALAPYTKEINSIGPLFKGLTIVAPLRIGEPPLDCIAYESDIVRFFYIPEKGGNTFFKKMDLIFSMPIIIISILKCINFSDALHVRCPGNIGLMGAILLLFSKKPRFAKYAGEWEFFKKQGLSISLQKKILKSRLFKGPVTFYGKADTKRPHLIPFYTSSLFQTEVDKGIKQNENKTLSYPIKIVFASRIDSNKGLDVLIKALNILEIKFPGRYILNICGDGNERYNSLQLIKKLKIENCVIFNGWVSMDSLFSLLAESHILVQPSLTSESWGKTLQEAMVHGVVPIASNIGGLKRQLAEKSELLFTPGNYHELAQTIFKITENNDIWLEFKNWCSLHSQNHNLQSIKKDLKIILENYWRIELNN